MELKISKVKGLNGAIDLPGDKSISHRAAILGAIAEGKTITKGFLNTGDCLSTVRCLSALGVEVVGVGGEHLHINGKGLRGLSEPDDTLDAGNSGTTARLMSGVLAGQDIFSVITGDDSLRGRPMGRITGPLKQMGASIWGRHSEERLPLAIKGSCLQGISHESAVASAQVKSAILIAGLMADGETSITEPSPSRDHTERMMRLMGADISTKHSTAIVQGGTQLKAAEIDIPADFSSAAFLIAGALITEKSELLLRRVGMNATRTGMLDVLRQMGADLKFDNMSIRSQESRADIIVRSSRLKGTRIAGDIIPRLIDEIPILAVVATQAEGVTVFRGISELRVKETDRIAAIVAELKKVGATIEANGDILKVTGPVKLKGGHVLSYGDHRMAMALSIAGLIAEKETVVEDAECIAVSFPGFERVLVGVAG